MADWHIQWDMEGVEEKRSEHHGRVEHGERVV